MTLLGWLAKPVGTNSEHLNSTNLMLNTDANFAVSLVLLLLKVRQFLAPLRFEGNKTLPRRSSAFDALISAVKPGLGFAIC